MARRKNKALFALAGRPAEKLAIGGATYALRRVFKHDFWAATCLYERLSGGEVEGWRRRLVVKFGRQQWFAGWPLGIIGRWLADHEESIYHALAGVEGVPRWAGRLGPTSCAIEYVDAVPLDHLETIPPGLFDRLRVIFEAIHARGVAYVDANKKSNLLVDAAGRPTVIDFQISLRRRPGLGRLVRYFQQKDLYHLYKHKRRLAPEALTADEEALSRRRSVLHRLHRKLTKPYRSLRRGWLNRQSRSGDLVSPTAELEDHHQPEKATWRPERGDG